MNFHAKCWQHPLKLAYIVPTNHHQPRKSNKILCHHCPLLQGKVVEFYATRHRHFSSFISLLLSTFLNLTKVEFYANNIPNPRNRNTIFCHHLPEKKEYNFMLSMSPASRKVLFYATCLSHPSNSVILVRPTFFNTRHQHPWPLEKY